MEMFKEMNYEECNMECEGNNKKSKQIGESARGLKHRHSCEI
jgi:hypothetical protein